MITEIMTIHKALCELKLLEAKIEKQLHTGRFVFANKHSNIKISGVPIEQFCDEITRNYQSITDMMRRQNAIKSAVVLSNANTIVTVGGQEHSVAVAIEIKNHVIPRMRELLKKMAADQQYARDEARIENERRLEERADEYVRSIYGSTDMKNLSEEAKKLRDEFINAQSFDVVDPLKIDEKMQILDRQISSFEVDIDSALSVSNALTTIEVSY